MSDDFLEPIATEGEVVDSDSGGNSPTRIILIVVIALIVLCCCCCGTLAALYTGTEPVMELLGIPIPW